ncbi:MAG: MBOAT family protein [Candidatus Lindowbacteria bacterium]|nr:MBOAT family protein [Candidatus Lindowbacteria bacterium]
MLFNSAQFGVFLIVVFLLYWRMRENRGMRHCFLLACSFYFYMCWNEKYLGLLVVSTLLDYFLGRAIYNEQRPGRRRLFLGASIAGNLGILGTFKYFNFFSENLNFIASSIGIEPFVPALDVLLPVGISFYTFQTMSYTIEIYQGKLEPCSSIIEFALFVSFFPQLVAGPIVRASQFLPQLAQTPELDACRMSSGLYNILKGLLKKVVIADYVGFHLVDKVFADPGAYGALSVLLAIYGFKLQIYGDFAGYSDIAIGSARMLGFELPINFKSPYKAKSIGEYWSRWHLTMGSWFRDFVYHPLGGSRKGEVRTYLNIMFTMFLVGLWHGASWTFICWGATYGLFLWIEISVRKLRGGSATAKKSWYRDLIAVVFTFHTTAIPTIFFRSENMTHVKIIFSKLFSSGGWTLSVPASVMAVMGIGYGIHFLPESWKRKSEEFFSSSPALAQAVALTVLLGLCVFLHLDENPFYYFQF